MSLDTKSLLLEVAGAVFAEHGYRAASIRDICQRADMNIAAVHYHFGDKESLYTEVLRVAYRQALSGPVEFLLASKLPPADKLRRFIETILRHGGSPSDTSWHGKLVTRELFDPSPPLETVLRELLVPLLNKLSELFGEFLGQAPSSEDVRRCALSVIGHCIYFDYNQPLLAQLVPSSETGHAQIQRLIDHIYNFSMGGILQVKAAAATPASPTPPLPTPPLPSAPQQQ
jgi:AcrR family transcriptional regulator